jgi:hypothetical protein
LLLATDPINDISLDAGFVGAGGGLFRVWVRVEPSESYYWQ